MENKNKKLSPRMESQIKGYAKKLAYKIDPSLEQDFIHDMYVLWLEFDLEPEALLWIAIKHEMSDIAFRSRKYRYSLSKLKFLSYEELVKERNSNGESVSLPSYQSLDSYLIYNDCMEDNIILNELLSCLSSKERMSLVLIFGYGYKGREVGELLGVTRSMISRYKSRAIEKIQEKVG
jgi:RNA polymerase sigma factor (sigma-70 family)